MRDWHIYIETNDNILAFGKTVSLNSFFSCSMFMFRLCIEKGNQGPLSVIVGSSPENSQDKNS